MDFFICLGEKQTSGLIRQTDSTLFPYICNVVLLNIIIWKQRLKTTCWSSDLELSHLPVDNHSKEQDIVASNFAFAEQQLKYALTQIDEARANESQESREKRESKGWGELTNPRSIKPDGSLELVVSKDWTSGFFPGELWYLYEYTHNPYWKEQAAETYRNSGTRKE